MARGRLGDSEGVETMESWRLGHVWEARMRTGIWLPRMQVVGNAAIST